MRRSFFAVAALISTVSAARADDEPVFSGPQTGEELAAFQTVGVYDDLAGAEIDPVARAEDKPLLLLFVHPPLNRPQLSVVRIVSTYARTREADGLSTAVIWLTDDRTAAEAYLKQARDSLAIKSPLLISLDGVEGPGSYGLNRNVNLTVLVADGTKVAANFAYIQPSATDVPKILEPVVKLIGGEVPPLKTLTEAAMGNARLPGANEPDPRFRELLRGVIRLDAKPEEVERAAMAVEEFIADDPALQRELGRIGRTIVDSGKLANYGTPPAQEQIKAWAEKYGGEPAKNEPPGDPPPKDDRPRSDE